MMHAARLAESNRLYVIYLCLSAAGKKGRTTQEISRLTGSCAPGTDISELRRNGIGVRCEYDGRTASGRKVYRYTLEEAK